MILNVCKIRLQDFYYAKVKMMYDFQNGCLHLRYMYRIPTKIFLNPKSNNYFSVIDNKFRIYVNFNEVIFKGET